jgi:hypothetical protein
MEDASAVDLDWFWRGWFYSTDHVDISLESVKLFQLNTQNPAIEKSFQKEQNDAKDDFKGDLENKKSIKKTINEKDTNIDDFYAKRDIFKVDKLDELEYAQFVKRNNANLELLNAEKFFYELNFKNIGGLVMPLIIRISYIDETSEIIRIPAEIWRRSEVNVSKVFILDKEVVSFRLDPQLETADTDLYNNAWPRELIPSRYDLFKQQKNRIRRQENPMQRQKRVDDLGN